MKRLLFIILSILIIIPCSLFAQTNNKVKVKGIVTDTKDEPLPGVSIFVKNQPKIGVASDIDGKFEIEVEKNSILVFSMLNMKNQEIEIKKNMSNLVVILKDDANMITEAGVVTGYTKQKKISVVGAVTNVDVEELKTPATSITNMLGGRVAGIITRQDSGEPGENVSNFWIRGISTFGAGQSALVLIDGLEGNLNTIDPDDIESFSVLKDAAATAVYGVRGANGVIIITTKLGKQGKLRLTGRATTKMSIIKHIPQYLESYDYALLANEARVVSGEKELYTPLQLELIKNNLDPDLYPNVNWYDQMLKRVSWKQNYYASAQGGGSVARYFLSIGYQTESAAYKQDKATFGEKVSYDLLTYRSNISFNLTELTELSFRAEGSMSQNTKPGGISTNQLWKSIQLINPMMYPVMYSDGTLPTYGAENMSSPYALLNFTGYNQSKRLDNKITMVLNQKFGGLLEGLNINFAVSSQLVSNYSVSRHVFPDLYLATGRTSEGKLIKSHRIKARELSAGKNESTYQKTYIETKALWSKIFGKHNVSAFCLYYMEESQNRGVSVDRIGLNLIPVRRQNLSGRLSYGYNNTYFIDANFGYTGSTQFKKGERFGFFPSLAAGWVPTSYKWVNEKMPWLNFFKIRGSYGFAGNDRISGTRFPYLTIINSQASTGWGYRGRGIEETQIGADNLQWEVSKKLNLGVDAQLFNSRVKFTIDVFNDTRDHIYQRRVTLPGSLGLVTIPFSNVGSMYSYGADGNISYTHVFNKDMSTTIRSNFTYSQNIIKYFEENELPYPYQSVTGKPYHILRGYIAEGLFKDKEDIALSPSQSAFGKIRPGDIKYRDVNGDGVINGDDRVPLSYSNQMPRIYYGIGADFKYKKLTVGVLFTGVAGMEYYCAGLNGNDRGWVPFISGEQGNVLKFVNNPKNRWTPSWYSGRKETENPNAQFPRLSYGKNNNNAQLSTFWKKNGSYIRFKELSVRYRLDQNTLFKKMGIHSVDCELVANNLFSIDNVKYFDPEQASHNGASYPIPTTIALQFYVKF